MFDAPVQDRALPHERRLSAATSVDPGIRIASVPSSHVYVRHLSWPRSATAAVVRLPDPHPTDPDRSAVSKWWPPRMLDVAWVREHLDDFDVFHIQFGFDAVPPARLEELAHELHSAGKPLVYTVHDLRNPHHHDPAEHNAQLAVLMAKADALITLTNGAAREIRSRWGRDARVIPHPHVVDADTMESAAARRSAREPDAAYRVGLHVKSLRANMNPLPLIRALAERLHDLPAVVLQVDGHPEVLDENGARYDRELSSALRDLHEHGLIDLRVHDYFSDADLWRYLESLDASVLPYRFGTHSGWLEACRDLGTEVIAPTCGYYADQGPVRSYGNGDAGFDADSLIEAVAASSTAPSPIPLTVEYRLAQREDIARLHEELYSELVR